MVVKGREISKKVLQVASPSSVMLFNAKIGKHNYSFSLKHKFNLQTAASSFLLLLSN